MKGAVEERLQDLERLVLKQVERIEALEDALLMMHRTARRDFLVKVQNNPETEAA